MENGLGHPVLVRYNYESYVILGTETFFRYFLIFLTQQQSIEDDDDDDHCHHHKMHDGDVKRRFRCYRTL
eukprot:scaffold2246_cov162-Amphora_coffeaeformis.AAC.17